MPLKINKKLCKARQRQSRRYVNCFLKFVASFYLRISETLNSSEESYQTLETDLAEAVPNDELRHRITERLRSRVGKDTDVSGAYGKRSWVLPNTMEMVKIRI